MHLWYTALAQVVRSLPHKEGVTHVQFIASPPDLLVHDRGEAGGAVEGVVITNCHPIVHTWSLHPAKDWNIEDRSGFDKLEEQVLMWMGNINLTTEISYMPLFMVTITSRVLLAPTYSALFPLLQPDIIRSTALWRTLNPNMTLQCEPGDWPSIPHELQSSMRQMLGSLHSLMTTLRAREEISYVGRMA